MRSVLVTGGNQGIGYAVCKQLATEHNCHVFLTARNVDKGRAAVSKLSKVIENNPSCNGSVDFIPLDTSSEASIVNAAEETRSKLSSGNLFGIVNNAGIGLNTGSSGDIIKTNFYGPKLVVENFMDMLDPNEGRIVNLGSGSGPMYVRTANRADQKQLCSPETATIEWIEDHWKKNLGRSDAYGLSKAMVALYTGILAREYPNIKSSCVTPGFVDTQMTAGWGASKTPDQAASTITHFLFEDLPGNGFYYGSDSIRSPYHFMRNPGEPSYDGVNPFV